MLKGSKKAGGYGGKEGDPMVESSMAGRGDGKLFGEDGGARAG